MPIIGHVGRRSFKVKALNLSIHLVLILGGITMVYPFLVMLAGSVKGKLDRGWLEVVPSYLYDREVLYKRYIEAKYNERLQTYVLSTRSYLYSFDKLPASDPFPARRVEDWNAFIQETLPHLSPTHFALAHANGAGIACKMARAFRAELKAEPDIQGDLLRLNAKYEATFTNWNQVQPAAENALALKLRRDAVRASDPYNLRCLAFLKSQPPEKLLFASLDGFWVETHLRPRYGTEVAKLNAVLGTRYPSWDSLHAARSIPAEGDPLRPDWIEFVKRRVGLDLVDIAPEAAPAWRAMLRAKYSNNLPLLCARHGVSCESFDQVPLLRDVPAEGFQLTDWADFIANSADPRHLRLRSVEFMYRDYLKARYATVEELNRAHGLAHTSFDEVAMPIREADYTEFERSRSEWRWEFLTRNYRMVFDVMWRNGYAISNTIIFCFLAVLAALIVNPMAAYALSRYKLPTAYKILLFFMLPVAFPPMVLGIPQFLMIRHLGLLNTFAALILPGLASGYSIFLLKGFFDSLPRELYESAQIDGASEWTMFWQITMATSKPILAVIALGAFTAAYGNFMMAFILCQDPKKWTMMVHLYQLQQSANPDVTYAALVVAAIPTFLVFVFCQNIIIKGIVVPTEK